MHMSDLALFLNPKMEKYDVPHSFQLPVTDRLLGSNLLLSIFSKIISVYMLLL